MVNSPLCVSAGLCGVALMLSMSLGWTFYVLINLCSGDMCLLTSHAAHFLAGCYDNRLIWLLLFLFYLTVSCLT
jgi:hypothetical protein